MARGRRSRRTWPDCSRPRWAGSLERSPRRPSTPSRTRAGRCPRPRAPTSPRRSPPGGTPPDSLAVRAPARPRATRRRARRPSSPLAAEHEVVPRLLPTPVRRADEYVARHAAHVVHHVAEHEAREAAIVGPDLGPVGRPLGRDLAVVDGGPAGAILVHHEVARAGEPGERLVVVAPELARPARRAAEALLEEREE